MALYNKSAGYGQQQFLNIANLGSGKIFVVGDSGTANEDMLRELFGYDPDGTLRFFDDIDEAVGFCTANAGDKIIVMPGHAETVTAAAGIDLDVAGISVIGLGQGEDRPIVTFTTAAAASMEWAAANVRVSGLVFKCNIASQNHMIDITSGDDGIIENCEFREGTQTGLSFITADTADNDCDRFAIRNCKFHAPTAGNYDNAIQLGIDLTGVRIENIEVYGDFDVACIDVPVGGNAQVDLQIKDVVLVNLLTAQHAIEINGTSSTGKIIRAYVQTDALATSIDAGGLEMFEAYYHDGTDQAGWTPVAVQPDSVANILGADDADNGFASTNVVANTDGSVLERLEAIQQHVGATDGATNILGADDGDNGFASTSVVVNGDGSIIERMEYLQDSQLVGGVDATTNTQMSDVVGNKTDAAIADTIEGSAATTQSLVADTKAILQRLGADSANNTAATTLVVANRDGSVLERLEQLEATVQKTISKVMTTPSGGADALFTITGGPIHVVSIWGIVTTVLVNAANGTLQATTTAPASTTAMSTTVAIDNDAAGTVYTFVGPTGVLTPTTAGVVLIDMGSTALTETQYIVPIGNINFLTSAAMTGVITWYMSYIPSPGAVVVAA